MSKREVKYVYPMNIRVTTELAATARQFAELEGATLSGFIRNAIVRNIDRVRAQNAERSQS